MPYMIFTVFISLCFSGFLSADTESHEIEILTLQNIQQKAGGIWLSDGYGYLIQSADVVTVYNITPTVCLQLSQDQDSPLNYVDRFEVDENATSMDIFSSFEPYRVTLNKIPQLPEHCKKSPSYNAIDVFDAFSSFYAQHYAFFEIHGVDWHKETTQIKKQLEVNTPDSSLIEPVIGLLSRLKDGHVGISGEIDGEEGEFIAYPGSTLQAVQEEFKGEGSAMAAFGKQFLREDIEKNILLGQGKNAVNERIKYGLTQNNIGYMAIMSVGGFSDKESDYAAEAEALRMALDNILSYFNQNKVKAVIIDLSVNRGGYDYLGRQIAERFTKKTVHAYSKYAADAKSKRPQKLSLNASKQFVFTGPVYVLTSDITVSAAEILTISLRALPNVTHVGSKTRGAFSDVLTKYLPNGWELSMSNEVYLDHEGINWEGRGVTPEVEFEVFNVNNPFSGHMPAIRKTIALINQHLDE
ncbi:S41 family peptidase [Marinicella sp. W31]|uniref:S41 family peptidase n=1 Tax=Marinicella sp. W31 TaxID=3023713 RepID=UPI0037569277